MVKITWFAAIMTSGFINLNVGYNGYKRWFACFVAKKSKIDHLGNGLMITFTNIEMTY